jgi:hypothetical protein
LEAMFQAKRARFRRHERGWNWLCFCPEKNEKA